MRSSGLRVFVLTLGLTLGFQLVHSQQNTKDVVICERSSTKPANLRCPADQVIQIRTAVYAYIQWISFVSFCEDPNILSKIETVSQGCKVERKFPSCDGEPFCTITPSTAKILLWDCYTSFLIAKAVYYSQILHVKYSCEPILKPGVTMVLLPLSEDVTGKTLRIHSPYYPCYTPAALSSLTCDITVASRVDKNQPIKLKLDVFAKFNEGPYCREMLSIDSRTSLQPSLEYCSTGGLMLRNDSESYDLPSNRDRILNFEYSKRNSGAGGKFMLQVAAFEKDNAPVDLRLSCNRQDRNTIDNSAEHLPEGCKPFGTRRINYFKAILIAGVIGTVIGIVVVLVVLCIKRKRKGINTSTLDNIGNLAPIPDPAAEPNEDNVKSEIDGDPEVEYDKITQV